MSAAMRPAAAAAALGLLSFAYLQISTPTQVEPPKRGSAFVFIKPHACNEKVQALVADAMKAKGIKINSEGEITGQQIDEKMLIDQHYHAIAEKATLLKPDQLNVDNAKFKAFFNEDWSAVLAEKRTFNAMDACREFGVDAEGLNKMWAQAKKDKKLLKLGGGFYAGKLTNPKTGKDVYCFNGFFMSMRAEFTAPGKKIHYYSVDFDPSDLKWGSFRGDLLGPTDPETAPKDSLRGQIYARKKELGVDVVNVGMNGVHASASPFEGLAERMNWLGVRCQEDQFCRSLVSSGVPEATIKAWTVDPQVKINKDGKKGSLFDAVEDLDVKPCHDKLVELYGYNK